MEQERPHCWRSSRDCNHRLPGRFGTTASFAVPESSADARIGYVPQDDIIHLEMPLRRTLRYAARLRLPAGTSAAEADRVVEETMR